MKKTFFSLLAVAISVTILSYTPFDSANASESVQKTSGILLISSSHPNTGGVYCGTTSGSFTTNSSGGMKLPVPNGTYTVCVGNESVSGIVVNNNFVGVNTDGGGACPCGN
jgi:hypothetical protein